MSRIAALCHSLFPQPGRRRRSSHHSPSSDSDDDIKPHRISIFHNHAKDDTRKPNRRASQGQQYLADMRDETVLVYRYRVASRVEVMRHERFVELIKDTSLRLTTKPIPRNALFVTLYQRDIDPQANGHPNAEQNVASVRLPFTIYLRKILGGKFPELQIVSVKTFGKPAGEGEADEEDGVKAVEE